MSDLIDRQTAIDALNKEINKGIPPFDDVMGSIRCGVRLARNIIEDLPSAQPENIRCTDCRWWSDKNGGFCDILGLNINDDEFFCAWGEQRREKMARLIDADELYLAIVEKGQASKRYKIGERWELNGAEILEVINAQPTAEPKTGHWLRYDIDGEPNEVDTFHWQCDQCLCTEHGRRSIPWRFCPNCGARMGGDAE